jgi:hypothetical protein
MAVKMGDNLAYKTHHLPFGYQWAILPNFIKITRMTEGFLLARGARFEFGDNQ